MKTKIIYISGNEVFDMHEIRAAFDEVRLALNLDKNTVLFGVPVDADDAGIMCDTKTETPVVEQTIPQAEEIKSSDITDEIKNESVVEITPDEDTDAEIIPTPKKRGRPRKEPVAEKNIIEETTTQNESIETENNDIEPTIPILSILSANETESVVEDNTPEMEDSTESDSVPQDTVEQVDIIPEIDEEKVSDEIVQPQEDESDLEQLLSAMTPLAEDTDEMPIAPEPENNDISVDATLEQLATEFAENQDKIAAESKSSARSKIGKLRNILPFKQSKHRDQGIGDLLEWAGIAANDEDFSVPGFFTNVASKK